MYRTRAWLIPLLLFPPCFVGLWCFVTLLLAQVGGWSQVAAVYPAQGDFAGQRWALQSGRMGAVRYGFVLTVGANEKGLALDVAAPFRVGHPSLFIPWGDISTSETQEWGASYTAFTFAKAPGVTLRLPRDLANEVLQARPDE